MTDEPPESAVLNALEKRTGVSDATIVDYEAILVEETPNRVYDLRVEADNRAWHGEFFLPTALTRPPAYDADVDESDEDVDDASGLEAWSP